MRSARKCSRRRTVLKFTRGEATTGRGLSLASSATRPLDTRSASANTGEKDFSSSFSSLYPLLTPPGLLLRDRLSPSQLMHLHIFPLWQNITHHDYHHNPNMAGQSTARRRFLSANNVENVSNGAALSRPICSFTGDFTLKMIDYQFHNNNPPLTVTRDPILANTVESASTRRVI